MNEAKKHIAVLCDYGLDDAIATLHLFENEDLFSRIDMIAVAGNFPSKTSLRNLRTLVAMSELQKDKAHIVSTIDLPQPTEELTFVHGNDGMGDLFEPCEDGTPVISLDEWLRDTASVDVLLSLAPLTVTEKILEKVKVGEFVFMAGCVDGVPNYKGYEFNHGVNPEAFAACAKHPHKAVTLDIACKALDISDFPLEGDSPRTKAMRRYRDFCVANGEVGCYVWDDIAVRYLLSPECFSTAEKTDRWGNALHCLIYSEKP